MLDVGYCKAILGTLHRQSNTSRRISVDSTKWRGCSSRVDFIPYFAKLWEFGKATHESREKSCLEVASNASAGSDRGKQQASFSFLTK